MIEHVGVSLNADDKRELDVQEARVRHADTQAAGIMVLAATAVGLLASGPAAGLGGRKDGIAYGLAFTFVCAILARLVDIVALIRPIFHADMENPEHRAKVAFWKAIFIAVALLGLVYSVYQALLAL